MITLLGAAGYTGRLIARALDQRRLPFRLAGRDPARLRALSETLASRPACLTADVRHRESLSPLFTGTRLLINCVGPFTDLGEPVVQLAAAHGVHYLDITNELAYVYRMRQYDRLARQTGAAIVPAAGFEVAVSDCVLAGLAAEIGRPLDSVDVVYVLGGTGMSLGTRLSGLRTFATSWLAYRGGKLVGQAPGGRLRRGEINGRPYAALSFPSAEAVHLPLHLSVRDVSTWMALSRRVAAGAPLVVPLLSWLLRTPLGALAAQIVQGILPPPAAPVRERDRFTIELDVRAGDIRRRQWWTGRDMYGLTGEIAAFAAQVMTAEGYAARGVLAPSQAWPAADFVGWLQAEAGLTFVEA